MFSPARPNMPAAPVIVMESRQNSKSNDEMFEYPLNQLQIPYHCEPPLLLFGSEAIS
jgi:hypothetical protein